MLSPWLIERWSLRTPGASTAALHACDQSLKASRGWNNAQTGREFLVTADTIARWLKRVNDDGEDALVALPLPVNRYPDFVPLLVQQLKSSCPLVGKQRIADIYKRGLCECLYVDNGSNYSSLEMTQVCQRIGAILCHTPVRDGAAKGKVERFFRTVREGFLNRQLDLSSLDSLNRAFTVWVEDEYHQREHSSLGMKPIDRFGLDLNRIRFLPPNEVSDELFFVEQDRTVLADNTFSLRNTRFEAPRDLRNRKIQIRFNRLTFERAIVYFKGDRMGEARPVDFVANDRKPPKNAPDRGPQGCSDPEAVS